MWHTPPRELPPTSRAASLAATAGGSSSVVPHSSDAGCTVFTLAELLSFGVATGRRRDLGRVRYSSVMCPDAVAVTAHKAAPAAATSSAIGEAAEGDCGGCCPRGYSCAMAHTAYEVYYHPDCYKRGRCPHEHHRRVADNILRPGHRRCGVSNDEDRTITPSVDARTLRCCPFAHSDAERGAWDAVRAGLGQDTPWGAALCGVGARRDRATAVAARLLATDAVCAYAARCAPTRDCDGSVVAACAAPLVGGWMAADGIIDAVALDALVFASQLVAADDDDNDTQVPLASTVSVRERCDATRYGFIPNAAFVAWRAAHDATAPEGLRGPAGAHTAACALAVLPCAGVGVGWQRAGGWALRPPPLPPSANTRGGSGGVTLDISLIELDPCVAMRSGLAVFTAAAADEVARWLAACADVGVAPRVCTTTAVPGSLAYIADWARALRGDDDGGRVGAPARPRFVRGLPLVLVACLAAQLCAGGRLEVR